MDSVIDGSDAQTVGLQSGDKILKVDGRNIYYKANLDEILEQSNGEELEVVIERDGQEQTLHFSPMEEQYNYTGIAVSTAGDSGTTIAAIYPNSPAAQQGLEANDVIVAVDGVEVENDAQKLVEQINQTLAEEMIFTIERNGETLEIPITPEVQSNYYMGVYLKLAENNFGNNIYYAFWETGEFAFSIVDNLKLLFTGNVSIDQMMGPVGIGEVVAETNGLADFVYILALVSISLGFTNLLPFPPLDGGKIVILLIEAIRRKPMKQETEMTIQMIGFMALIGLAVIVTYNDVLRVF